MAGQLIAITAENNNISIDMAKKIAQKLGRSNKKVAIINVRAGYAPETTKSPYISALFDINNRLTSQNTINQKLACNDYVIALGYTMETINREAKKFTSTGQLTKFTTWIEKIENETYFLKPASKNLLFENMPINQKNKGQKPTVSYGVKYETFSTTGPIGQAVSYILSTANPPKALAKKVPGKPSKYTSTLYDVLVAQAAGENVSYVIDDSAPVGDGQLQKLLDSRKIIKKMPVSNYLLGITLPLGMPARLLKTTTTKPHNSHLMAMADSLNTGTYPSPNHEISIQTTPKNDIELVAEIENNYGISRGISSYKGTIKIIKAWAKNQPEKSNLYQTFTARVSCKLSLYDIILLSSNPNFRLAWPPLSARNGYVDCSAPPEIESLVQEHFDNSTAYSAVAETSDNPSCKYLLLGAITPVTLVTNWAGLLKIASPGYAAQGSELLHGLSTQIINHLSEKLPLFYEYRQ